MYVVQKGCSLHGETVSDCENEVEVRFYPRVVSFLSQRDPLFRHLLFLSFNPQHRHRANSKR